MEEKKPSERVIEIIKPYFEAKGFTYKKSQKEFLRKFPLGRQKFSLSFDGRGGIVTVNCGFFIFFDELINLSGKIFDEKTGDWSFQISENLLEHAPFFKHDVRVGFLFDSRFEGMTLAEKSKYSSYIVHPERKIKQGADFIIKAFELYAEPHFNKIDNYETLYNALINSVRVRYTQVATPYINLILCHDEEKLVYDSLILALCLNKETTAIEELLNDMLGRYTVGKEEVKQNIQKIYDYDKTKNLKNLLE